MQINVWYKISFIRKVEFYDISYLTLGTYIIVWTRHWKNFADYLNKLCCFKWEYVFKSTVPMCVRSQWPEYHFFFRKVELRDISYLWLSRLINITWRKQVRDYKMLRILPHQSDIIPYRQEKSSFTNSFLCINTWRTIKHDDSDAFTW